MAGTKQTKLASQLPCLVSGIWQEDHPSSCSETVSLDVKCKALKHKVSRPLIRDVVEDCGIHLCSGAYHVSTVYCVLSALTLKQHQETRVDPPCHPIHCNCRRWVLAASAPMCDKSPFYLSIASSEHPDASLMMTSLSFIIHHPISGALITSALAFLRRFPRPERRQPSSRAYCGETRAPWLVCLLRSFINS
jgi:hypothetical protein